MMQSTIRGELTRILRTNSSVDIFEQNGLGEVTTAKSSIESPRGTRGSPRKHWSEARRKSNRSPMCTKYNIPGSLSFILFSKSHQQARKVVQRFWVVSASQLWLAPLLLNSSDACTVSRGRTADERVRVECLSQFLFFGCVQSQK